MPALLARAGDLTHSRRRRRVQPSYGRIQKSRRVSPAPAGAGTWRSFAEGDVGGLSGTESSLSMSTVDGTGDGDTMSAGELLVEWAEEARGSGPPIATGAFVEEKTLVMNCREDALGGRCLGYRDKTPMDVRG